MCIDKLYITIYIYIYMYIYIVCDSTRKEGSAGEGGGGGEGGEEGERGAPHDGHLGGGQWGGDEDPNRNLWGFLWISRILAFLSRVDILQTPYSKRRGPYYVS